MKKGGVEGRLDRRGRGSKYNLGRSLYGKEQTVISLATLYSCSESRL